MKGLISTIKDWVLTKIAIILFYLGFVPKCTSFIDEVRMSYGYGKLNGGIGVWQYQLPFGFIEKQQKK